MMQYRRIMCHLSVNAIRFGSRGIGGRTAEYLGFANDIFPGL